MTKTLETTPSISLLVYDVRICSEKTFWFDLRIRWGRQTSTRVLLTWECGWNYSLRLL